MKCWVLKISAKFISSVVLSDWYFFLKRQQALTSNLSICRLAHLSLSRRMVWPSTACTAAVAALMLLASAQIYKFVKIIVMLSSKSISNVFHYIVMINFIWAILRLKVLLKMYSTISCQIEEGNLISDVLTQPTLAWPRYLVCHRNQLLIWPGIPMQRRRKISCKRRKDDGK